MSKIKSLILALVFAVSSLSLVSAPSASAVLPPDGGGATCTQSRILTFPTWYRGLDMGSNCVPRIASLNDFWKIALNILDIMLQIAGYCAAGFIMWGGFKYIKSQGNPSNITEAKGTIMNAAIGLGVALSGVAIVNFIGSTIK